MSAQDPDPHGLADADLSQGGLDEREYGKDDDAGVSHDAIEARGERAAGAPPTDKLGEHEG